MWDTLLSGGKEKNSPAPSWLQTHYLSVFILVGWRSYHCATTAATVILGINAGSKNNLQMSLFSLKTTLGVEQFLSRSYKTSSSTLTTEERSSGVVSPPGDQTPIVFRWRLKGRGSSFVRICCVCSVCCPSFSCSSLKRYEIHKNTTNTGSDGVSDDRAFGYTFECFELKSNMAAGFF